MAYPTFKIDQAKSLFFDRKKVIDAVEKTDRRRLSKFGAYVRRTARGSIRKQGKKGLPSQPGKPPKSITGLLKKFIFFVYDPSRHSVIIGPQKTDQTFPNGDGQPRTGTVPEVLEYGGEIAVREVFDESRQTWSRGNFQSRRTAGKKTRMRTVKVAARPYMGPAFEENQQKIPEIWANSLK